MIRWLATLTLLPLLQACSNMPCSELIATEEVRYRAGDTELRGFLAWDRRSQDARPGVIVVHEWWGHNEYARKRARMLAELGYTALAVDMYGDGKRADHPSDAGQFASAVMEDLDSAQRRFEAGLRLLREHDTTDPERMAAIGYCFGGAVVLHMARAGVDLDAVASFHGMLRPATPAERGRIKARVLVCTGADDPMIPPADVEALRAEMAAAGARCEVESYPGVVHSFTNPNATALGEQFGLPLRYDARADAASWAKLQQVLLQEF